MSRRRLLAPRSLQQILQAHPSYRQTLLGTVDNCALSALFELEGAPFTNAAQARGIIFHRFAAELIRTLRRTGETRIPTQEAIEILYEVARQRDVEPGERVIVPMRERRTLRICALALAALPLRMDRLIDVERQLAATLTYDTPEGLVQRTITGRPDALLADPPNGAIVLDWKTAPSAPAKGDQPHWTGDHLHVSYEGYFQQRFYALLVLRNYPAVERVTLREYYVLPREAREAVVPREALEHIEREISAITEYLDLALIEGSRSEAWQPSPGRHCAYCRRPQSCPIEREARAAQGGISSAAAAARAGAEFAVADVVREETREACKAWHDETGQPIPVKSAKGRYELRWGTDAGGRRRFGLHVPEASDRGPEDPDLAAAFAEAAAAA